MNLIQNYKKSRRFHKNTRLIFKSCFDYYNIIELTLDFKILTRIKLELSLDFNKVFVSASKLFHRSIKDKFQNGTISRPK